ncbi:vomeronasal type-1 receptor 1-like [Notamacropus eugenii]|uniref:vomeronasal type-1 receptor 1-like n=1 Tax=Notamacropus eugenii TaxID=9315 RepID=UPI003B677898
MILGIFFFSQTGIGLIGNSFLISLFIIMFLSRHRLRPIETIVTELALVNCLALLSKGVPQTMVTLGMKNFLDTTGCKITLYLHRVARCLSVTLTCLLSGFQAITISPNNSSSAHLKARAPKYIIPTSLLCWTFQLLLNVFIPIGMIDPKHTRNITEIQHHGYCSHLVPSGFRASLYAFILSFPDTVLMGFMVFASGYMVLLLYRHHKHVEQIHINCISTRVSPETRATKTILLLVSIFVSSYSLDCILTAYMSFMKSSRWLVHCSALMTSFFPTISPYVLISSDSQVPKYCYALCGRRSSNFNGNST